MDGWRDRIARSYPSSLEKSISKSLLEHYADPEDELDEFQRGGELHVYRRYLQKTMSTDLSHGNLAALGDDLLGAYYSVDQPTRSPQKFDVFAKDGNDISLLELVVGKKIVVVQLQGGRYPTKIHDRRIYDVMLESHDGNGVGSVRRRWRTDFFVLEALGKPRRWVLHAMTDLDGSYSARLSEHKFFAVSHSCVGSNNCYIAAIARCLDIDIDDHSHDQGGNCKDMLYICTHRRELVETLHQEFILVSHLRTRPLPFGGRDRDGEDTKGGNNVFATLTTARLSGLSLRLLPVIALTNDGYAYLLSHRYREEYFSKIVDSSNRFHKAEQHPDPADQFPAGASSGHGSKKNKRASEAGNVTVSDSTCQCRACKTKGLYSEQMSENGPQHAIQTEIPLVDLLRVLGIWTREREECIKKVTLMSLASFDVEAFTSDLDSYQGNEDVYFPHYETVSDLKLPRRIMALQKPVMVALTDHLRLSSGLEPKVFTVDHVNEAYRELCKPFVEEIYKMRDLACVCKFGKLSWLFEWLEPYKEAHYEFYNRLGWVTQDEDEQVGQQRALLDKIAALKARGERVPPSMVDEAGGAQLVGMYERGDLQTIDDLKQKRRERRRREIDDAWRWQIIGRLEHEATQLATTYKVFAFNGER
jgi:hypothetical protein